MRGLLWKALIGVGCLLFSTTIRVESSTQNSYDYIYEEDKEVSLFNNDYSSLMGILVDDEEVIGFTLPFDFRFFGNWYDHAYLSSNGLLSFANQGRPISGASSHNKHTEHISISKFKKSPDNNLHKTEDNLHALGDTYMIVLHRHVKSHVTHLVVENIHSLHENTEKRDFVAEVKDIHPHLRMFTVLSPSAEALRYLKEHEHVHHVHREQHVYAIDRPTGTTHEESFREASLHSMTSNPYSWGLDRIDQSALPLDEASYEAPADSNGGSGVSVYVVDTGLDTTHVEFANTHDREVLNIFSSFDHNLGANTDGNGHGSHCAGTVGGVNVGVAPKANIYGVKVLDTDGSGTTGSVVAGLESILSIRLSEPSRPMVVSMSLGGDCEGPCDEDALVIAVEELTANDITVVVAAGNDAEDACGFSPAAAESAITVGATSSDDSLAYYSCFGTCVDILAPGTEITSVCPSTICGSHNNYAELSGTSMATPHVAGVSALWLSQTATSWTYPPPAADVALALQCTSVKGDISISVPLSTVNLLLQVPPPGVGSMADAACDSSVGCSESSNGTVCSGHGDCVFGVCVCTDNFIGDHCELTGPPPWVYSSYCCNGESLANSETAPYDVIAFLWTDLDPFYSAVYLGTPAPGSIGIVFQDVMPYGYFCTSTVELLFDSSGKIEIQYLGNTIGERCGTNLVSVGIKGTELNGASSYEQAYGPCKTCLSDDFRLTYLPKFTSSPTTSPAPSQAPSLKTTTQNSYSVTIDPVNDNSLFEGDYSSLHVTLLDDEEVIGFMLPFDIQFFGKMFDHAYVSSNGLLSLAHQGRGSHSSTFSEAHKRRLSSSTFNRGMPKQHTANSDHSRLLDKSTNVKFMIVLHRHVKSHVTHVVVENVRSLHGNTEKRGFVAEVKDIHPHLRMFTVLSPSAEALRYLKEHEHVHHVHRERHVYAIDRPTGVGTTHEESFREASLNSMTSNPYSWGLDRIDQSALPLDEASYEAPADTNGGSGVSVYVVDTGLDTTHVEFANTHDREVLNIFSSFDHNLGANTDGNGHGSHCAGTVGGVNVGVAPKANIYGVKVLDTDGSGTTGSVVAGLESILSIRLSEPSRPMVVSMSLGGDCEGTCDEDALVIAVEELTANDITVVVAAGNDAEDACGFSPAAAESAITVGATSSDDSLAYYSCFGTCVDILAPGTDIKSVCSSLICGGNTQYARLSGTSMSTPHVAGVSALWLSQTATSWTYPPPATDVALALQCTSVKGDISMSVPLSTVNLLLQVPPPGVGSMADAACDSSVGCSESSNGTVCSGHGDCVFGVCVCTNNYMGDECDILAPPPWVYSSYCCNGESLANSETAPYDVIAFLWTDLDPYFGKVYYGSSSDDEFGIVFSEVNPYGGNCASTIEVLMDSAGSIRIEYISNPIGNHCGSNVVSVGIKGSKDSIDAYEQVYGPALRGIPGTGRVSFYPLLTSSPTITPAPSNIPSISLLPTSYHSHQSWYDVSKQIDNDNSMFEHDYSLLSTITLGEEEVFKLDFDFDFRFFNNYFDHAFVSSNGLISFFHEGEVISTFCCDGESLSVDDDPFNTIAFMWTDLDPSAGKIHHGYIGDNRYGVVFQNVRPFSRACTATIEVIVSAAGAIEIAYIDNAIGFDCGDNLISIGIKGSHTSGVAEGLQYEQVYGPSLRGIPSDFRLKFSPLFSDSPTISPVPTRFPTHSVFTQFSYAKIVDTSAVTMSLFNNDYSSLNHIHLDDEQVIGFTLPFDFRFFGNYFDHAYLNSNGLISFAQQGRETSRISSAKTNRDNISFKTVIKKKSKDKEKNNANAHALGDTYMIVLHRHVKSHVTHLVVENIHSLHENTEKRDFVAEVKDIHPHLRMFTVLSPSAEALRYLKEHEHVHHVHREQHVYAIDRPTGTTHEESFREASLHSMTSNPYSWGLDRIDQSALPLDEASYEAPADSNGGSGVSVYVVDTGLDTTHVEFANTHDREVLNIFSSFDHNLGVNTDGNGHGSHCAGTVGGVNVGVAPKANIYGVKVLDTDGSGTTSSAVAGLESILSIRLSEPSRPMVVSMSLGGECSGPCDEDALVIAVEELTANDITVVVAAGNEAEDSCGFSPAAAKSAITVGATAIPDHLAPYSCYGTCVNILAPGSAIKSVCSSSVCGGHSKYAKMSGTSMATPHVAGVSALWLSQTATSWTYPPPTADVALALQCTSVKGDISMSVPLSTVNLLLQVPPPGVGSMADAACDSSVGCSESSDGTVCSGHGDCVFGVCVCTNNYMGDECEKLGPPPWVYSSYCCNGESLANSETAPYDVIAFLWTDLNPESGKVYTGSPSGDDVAIVFHDVSPYGTACPTTVELLFDVTGRIEIVLLQNPIGFDCGENDVSVGIKGNEAGLPAYEQVAGPSMRSIPSNLHVSFNPLFSTVTNDPSNYPSSAPTSVPSPPPSLATHYFSHNSNSHINSNFSTKCAAHINAEQFPFHSKCIRSPNDIS